MSGETIDRVYCDYHDDFVSRTQAAGKRSYHFYQVKTKGKRNYQWTKLDMFGLYKKQKPKAKKIAESFAGKLLLHTVRFRNSCGSVFFLTNVQFDDDIERIVSSLGKSDFSNGDLKALIENFNEAFVDSDALGREAIEERLRKLVLRPGITYLDPHDESFHAIARDAIFRYSEIDLQHLECEEIIHSLVSMVEVKSFSKLISELDETELDDTVGVGVADLLEILSISKGAYDLLVKGGDPSAIKNASIIQRKLTEAGASETMIEYCSSSKIQWDIWFRDKRHMLPEFDLNFLLEEINTIKNRWVGGALGFSELHGEIDELWTSVTNKGLAGTLTRDLLLGGIFAALVRSESL